MAKEVAVADELAEAASDEEEAGAIMCAFLMSRSATMLRLAKSDNDAAVLAAPAGVTLSECGIRTIKQLDKTTIGEARKDPAAHRGQWIQASGTVIQIRRAKSLFEGLMITAAGRAISFVTPGKTDGIVEGSPATFTGIFVQEHNFPNISGGETQSLLLVGHFSGQGMD